MHQQRLCSIDETAPEHRMACFHAWRMIRPLGAGVTVGDPGMFTRCYPGQWSGVWKLA